MSAAAPAIMVALVRLAMLTALRLVSNRRARTASIAHAASMIAPQAL